MTGSKRWRVLLAVPLVLNVAACSGGSELVADGEGLVPTTAPSTTTTSTPSTTTTATTTTKAAAPPTTVPRTTIVVAALPTTTTAPTTLPPVPTGDSCPGGDYSPSPNDGSCSAPTTLAPPPEATAPPAPIAVLADAATACLNDAAAFSAAKELISGLGTPPGGLTKDEWAAQKWTDDFTVDPDGSYTINAWVPGNPAYDDRFQLAAIQCLSDRTQMPQGVRSAINSATVLGTTDITDWQVGSATIRVQWGWDLDSVLTTSFWQD